MVNETIIAGIVVGVIGLVLFLKSKGGEMTPPTGGLAEFPGLLPVAKDLDTVTDTGPTTLNDIYKQVGSQFGVDWRLLKAIAQVESNENPNAVNPADPSTGLMQVLCIADDPDEHCRNNFNIMGWDDATPNTLFDPYTNVFYAAQILEWNQRTFGFVRGIAVYNSWGARHDPEDGPFRNQSYVDKVMGKFTTLVSANPE